MYLLCYIISSKIAYGIKRLFYLLVANMIKVSQMLGYQVSAGLWTKGHPDIVSLTFILY